MTTHVPVLHWQLKKLAGLVARVFVASLVAFTIFALQSSAASAAEVTTSTAARPCAAFARLLLAVQLSAGLPACRPAGSFLQLPAAACCVAAAWLLRTESMLLSF